MNDSPVTLVTGCSSGIGLAAAVEFAARGHTVIATLRDPARGNELADAARAAGATLDVRALDVTDDAAVSSVIAGVIADHGAIDVVISNAGLGVAGTTEELSLDDFRAAFETNVLGSVSLLHAVLPSWRERRAGRFVAVSSVAGAVGQPFNDAYCGSKFALEGILESLRPVVAPFGISVSMIEPGPVAGVFVDKSREPGAGTGDDPYAAMRERFHGVQAGGYAVAQTNEEIAGWLWDVANADAPALRYQTSGLVTKMVALKLTDLDGARVTGMTGGWLAGG